MKYEIIRKYVEEVIVDWDVRDEIFNGGDAVNYEVEIQSISHFIEKHDINKLTTLELTDHISVAFNTKPGFLECGGMASDIIETLKIIKEYVKEE